MRRLIIFAISLLIFPQMTTAQNCNTSFSEVNMEEKVAVVGGTLPRLFHLLDVDKDGVEEFFVEMDHSLYGPSIAIFEKKDLYCQRFYETTIAIRILDGSIKDRKVWPDLEYVTIFGGMRPDNSLIYEYILMEYDDSKAEYLETSRKKIHMDRKDTTKKLAQLPKGHIVYEFDFDPLPSPYPKHIFKEKELEAK